MQKEKEGEKEKRKHINHFYPLMQIYSSTRWVDINCMFPKLNHCISSGGIAIAIPTLFTASKCRGIMNETSILCCRGVLVGPFFLLLMAMNTSVRIFCFSICSQGLTGLLGHFRFPNSLKGGAMVVLSSQSSCRTFFQLESSLSVFMLRCSHIKCTETAPKKRKQHAVRERAREKEGGRRGVLLTPTPPRRPVPSRR